MEPHIARLGERYRSQWLFPKLRHIADFVLLDRRIILEVDGSSHDKPEQKRKDILHTIALENQGYAVIRVRNEEALTNGAGVVASFPALLSSRPTLQELQASLAEYPPPVIRVRQKRTPTRPPTPSPVPRANPGPSLKKKVGRASGKTTPQS
mgnify:CR=1 FL=1